VNIFRRLPLYRLLLGCAVVLVVAISATALAFALGSGPTPPAKPLAVAVHDALAAPPVEGVSASVKLTDNLLEGANLAGGEEHGELTSNPLLAGGTGRLWISKDGRVRIELQAEQGDTEILYDGHTLQAYDAATNTLYRLTPPATASATGTSDATSGAKPEIPSVAKIEQAIAHLTLHADVSGATPSDVAGHAAYTVRVAPNEGGSLLGGAELSFDAETGVPLRSALYASGDASPVIELAATDISYGPVADSVFAFTPPASAKIVEVKLPSGHDVSKADDGRHGSRPKLSTHGHGVSGIAVLESKSSGTKAGESPVAGLPQVKINGVTASELRTELGTILSFERSGVRYIVAGSVTPATLEAFAAGL
jgi:outer membrane lipoprotein-sorting protein